MSDWEPAVKIGSKVRGGPVQKETVVRGKGALNAAQRSGAIIGAEKKFAVGNAVSCVPLPLSATIHHNRSPLLCSTID